jgi:hypothetical protein
MPITLSSSGMCAARAWVAAFGAENRLTREALVA